MASRLARVLGKLEAVYGKQGKRPASDPYEMLVFANAAYPASEVACTKGFDSIRRIVGIAPARILAAPKAQLVQASRAGGMLPERRAERLREIARVIEHDYGGDLMRALRGVSVREAMRILKRFPTIANAGAEKIILFCRLAPVIAVPSNALQVPLRLGWGTEGRSWAASYKSAQSALAAEMKESFEPRIRAHRLLKQHGQETCKPSRPQCDRCPVTRECAYYATHA